MATFTMELRDVIDVVGENGVGLSDYPIFDEAHRATLNRKILDHYWYYEIGHETIDQFVRQMRTKMQEVMPYFNEMYKTTLVKYDILSTVDIIADSKNENSTHSKTSGNSNSNESGNSTTSTDSTARAVSSEMPQTRLAGDADYATAATDSTSNGVTETASSGSRGETTAMTGDGSAQGSATSHQSGYTGTSPAALISAARDAIINVDMMVIDSVSTLFMSLWNNGDTYTNGGYYEFY